jgi:hypothetical protein
MDRVLASEIERGNSARRRLDVAGAAEYCGGVSTAYLNKLRVTGEGPVFIRLGRRIVYDSGDLDDWLAAGRRRSTSDAREVA